MADSPKVPLGDKPGIGNWTERYHALGGKTNWIRRTAEHLKGKGMADGHAIAIAVNAAQRMCESGDTNFPGAQQVNPGSRAEACAAYTQWKVAKAKANAARAKDMSARRVCEHFRQIDLARAYLHYLDGVSSRLPRGATAAYLELAEQRSDTVDLAYDEAKHPRDELGHWIAIAADLIHLPVGGEKRVSRGFSVERLPGDNYRVTMMKGTRHEQSIHASSPGEAASVALGHSLNDRRRIAAKMRAQVGKSTTQILPKRVNNKGMALSAVREALALDLSRERN